VLSPIRQFQKGQEKMKNRKLNLLMTISVLLIIGCSDIDKDFKTNANEFLREGEKLTIMTEQGVSYDKYKDQLTEVKIAYSLLEEDWPSSLETTKVDFDKAIQGWDLVIKVRMKDLDRKAGMINDLAIGEVMEYCYDKTSNKFEVDIGSADLMISDLLPKANHHFEDGKEKLVSAIK